MGINSIKESIIKNKKEIFFLFLIFLLAFGVRAHLMIYDLMFGFDSYFHARITEFVIQNFTVPSVDPLAYYQLEGGSPLPVTGSFFWFFSAILFKILTLGAAFSKSTWITAVKFFPALFGALISVAMYFLGKQMYGKKAGVTMAVFASVIPAFVYRTMAGFFEEDALGFLWLVVGLVFFARAVKDAEFNKETIKNSFLAAFFFILMTLTWEMFILIPMILIAWFFSTIVLMWFRKENKEKIINLAKTFALTIILFAIVSTLFVGPAWTDKITSYVTKYAPVTGENIDRIQSANRESGVFAVSVGEEQLGFRFWGNKYSALIVFPILALLIFIPYRLFRRKNDYSSFLLFYWILITMFMAYLKLKFTFAFGLPVAVAAGVTLHELLIWTGNRPGFEKKLIAFVLGFMFLVGIASGTFFVSQNVPNIEQNTGWKESLLWINENTPEDSKFFNWWDEGHWITFIAERGVTADNRNYSGEANSDMANFILTDSVEKATEIVRGNNPDYVILSEDLIGKMGSLGLYAFNGEDSNERIANYFSIAMPCFRLTDPLNDMITVHCGNNSLSEQEYLAIPYKRITEPNQLLEGKVRVFIYRNEAGTKLFIMNNFANDTMIVKLFFDIENVSGFEEFYSNKEVRIYKPTFS